MTEPTVDALIDLADGLPIGPEERGHLERAVALAVANGDEEGEYRARLRLTSSVFMQGDTETTFANFAWTLARHDSDPVRFPAREGHFDLLWQYKWMPEALARHPRFPWERVEQTLDDMERRYRQAGAGVSGVWQARFATAMDRGDLAAAARFREEREAAGRDAYSHCEACVRSEDADFLDATGDLDAALEAYGEIEAMGLSCGSEPERAGGQALLRMLRAGHLDWAKATHLRSLWGVRRNPDPFPLHLPHLIFCAVTGNEARGLALLERYLPALADDPLELTRRFATLRAYGVLLDAVTRAGHGDAPVRGATDEGAVAILGPVPDGGWTARTLAEASWTGAAAIAEQFDARNGTSRFADLLAAGRALADEHWHLPIGQESFAGQDVVPEEPRLVTEEDWVERVIELVESLDDLEGAIDTARRAVRHVGPEPLRHAIGYALDAEQPGDAEELSGELVAELRRLGRDAEAEAEQQLGFALHRHSFADGGVLASAADAQEQGPAIVRARTLLRLGQWLLYNDRREDAAEVLELVLPVVREAGDRVLVAEVLFSRWEATPEDRGAFVVHADDMLGAWAPRAWRARNLKIRAKLFGLSGDFEAGYGLAEKYVSLAAEIGSRVHVADGDLLAAMLLSDLDRDSEAAAYAADAARQLELAGVDPTDARLMQGKYLMWADRLLEAVDVLEEAVAGVERNPGEPEQRAAAHFWLAAAAQGASLFQQAYTEFTEALRLAVDDEIWPLAVRTGIRLSDILMGDDDAEAAETLSLVLPMAREHEPDALVDVLHRLGQAQGRVPDPAALDTLDEAYALAMAQENEPLSADIQDSKGRALLHLGRVDEAVPLLLGAADRFAAAEMPFPAAMVELFTARSLVEADRLEQASAVYASSLERQQPNREAWFVTAVEYADVLEALGRTEEARNVRSLADAVAADGEA